MVKHTNTKEDKQNKIVVTLSHCDCKEITMGQSCDTNQVTSAIKAHNAKFKFFLSRLGPTKVGNSFLGKNFLSPSFYWSFASKFDDC